MVKNYADRVRKLENMGATTSDAQAAVDAEIEKEGKTKMKHTPGPWRVGDRFNTVFGPPNGNSSPEIIAYAHKGIRANATLIAAAPDMLVALQVWLDCLTHPNIPMSEATRLDLIILSKAAIAKAEGV